MTPIRLVLAAAALALSALPALAAPPEAKWEDLLMASAQGDAVNPDPDHPSEIVEYTADGRFVAELSVDPAAGSAFGLALEERGGSFRFAAVDDGQNVLDVWDVRGRN